MNPRGPPHASGPPGITRGASTNTPWGLSGGSPAASGAAAGAGTGASTARTKSLAAAAGGTADSSPANNLRVGNPTGALTLAFPIRTSPARGSVSPSLALTYDSSAGNGVFGLGWHLNIDTIVRKTTPQLPRYQDRESSDEFVLAGCNDLVPSDVPPILVASGWRVQRFYPQIQREEAIRVERWQNSTQESDVHWRTISADNVTTVFGPSDDSRICESPGHRNGHQKRIFSWLIAEQYDAHGNCMRFRYKREDGAGVTPNNARTTPQSEYTQRYLKSIVYGNQVPNRRMQDWVVGDDLVPEDGWLFEVIFDYGEHSLSAPTVAEETPWRLRKDPYSSGEAGFEIRTMRLCHRVLMFHNLPEELAGARETLVASTRFEYDDNSRPDGVSLLSSITPCGYRPGLRDESLPPQRFSYGGPPDLSKCDRRQAEAPGLFGSAPDQCQWLDLDEEGIPGALVQTDGGWTYHPNQSAAERPARCQFGPPRRVDLVPSTAVEGWVSVNEPEELGTHLSALSLSGQGFYSRTDDGGWRDFVPFPRQRNGDSSRSPNILTADLTRSGFPDTIIFGGTDPGESVWYPNLGRAGSGERRRIDVEGPLDLPFDDPLSAVTMTDMTGDGLADIVVIRNGRIVYWPNQGHGRFGQPVDMHNAPWLADFSPRRLKLVDLTCTGSTDIVYFSATGGGHVYYNCTGNGWSSAYHLGILPQIDDATLSSIECLDLLGQGTPCICWQPHTGTDRPELHYVDVLAGGRPGLMTAHRNGVGMERTFTYCSSTTFYLEDRKQGAPWPHRLPFPNLCLEKVLVVDHIAHTAQTLQYAYHDGYYDRRDREFRGFGRIEEWQTEVSWDDASLITQAVEQSTPIMHQKTWYHLGQPSAAASTAPGQVLSPSPLPTAIDSCRALKGSPLRIEIHDPRATTSAPLSVEEHNYSVLVRPETSHHRRRAYLVQPRESLTVVLDGQEVDNARVTHEVNLQVNEFGQTTKSVTTAYGCNQSELADPDQRRRQQETIILYSEVDYTNGVDKTASEGLRLPAPCETRSYRILSATRPVRPLTYEDLIADNYAFCVGAKEVPRGSSVPVQGRSKVLTARQRTYYRSNRLTPLPYGRLDLYSMVEREYQLALTAEDLSTLADILPPTGSVEAQDLLQTRGGYCNLLGDGQWWSPSAQSRFAAGDPEAELQAARRRFFRPTITIDPFGSRTYQEYDAYHLLLKKTIDHLGNTVQFGNDYLALAATATTDQNGNCQRVAFDALGRVVGVSIEGKAGAREGDSMQGFLPQITEAQLQSFVDSPPTEVNGNSFLAQAGQRTIYGTGRYQQSVDGDGIGTPDFKATITRHEHGSADSKVKVEIEYLDGLGAPVQVASLEAPGKWRFSGWQARGVNGEGRREWQPFYSASHHFQYQPVSPESNGLTTTSFHDALGRTVSVLHADHSWTKDRYSPWTTVAFDKGDTVLMEDPSCDPDVGAYFRTLPPDAYRPSWYAQRAQSTDPWMREAANKATVYSNTPSVTEFDALARPIVVVADNGPAGRQSTEYEYDHVGNTVRVINAMRRTIWTAQYDLAGRAIYDASMDSGEHWALFDCLSRPLLLQDSTHTRKRFVYDSLQRKTEEWLQEGCGPERLVIKMVYGESHPEAEKHNLRGQLHLQYDQSGLTEVKAADFKGNPIQTCTQLAEDYKSILNWSRRPDGDAPSLEPVTYETRVYFDGLNNAYCNVAADGSQTRRIYNWSGQLQSLSLLYARPEEAARVGILDIAYTPWGAQEKITHANGVTVRSTFSPETQMVLRFTVQQKGTRDGNQRLRDVSYTYDCMRRVTHVHDHARQETFFRNCVIPPSQDYEYDAVGQLVRARGREQVVGSQMRAYTATSPTSSVGVPGDGTQMCAYVETYRYDAAGNILELRHEPQQDVSVSGWTRKYEYGAVGGESPAPSEPPSDRLTSTIVRGSREEYTYDGRGCMVSMPGYSALGWDHTRLLRFSAQQRVKDGTPETTWYVYNASGERVRKVTERAAAAGATPTKLKETRQLPGCKIYRKFAGDGSTVQQEIQTCIVLESWGAQANTTVAMVEALSTSGTTLVRYQVDQSLELSDEGEIVSYEEFSPYGVTTFNGVRTEATAPRQYRFARYERDEETGLFHCGERYYAAWLGRWTSPDPIGLQGGLNLYLYANNDPANLEDGAGTAPDKKSNLTAKPKEKEILSKRTHEEMNLKVDTLKAGEKAVYKQLHQDMDYDWAASLDYNTAIHVPLGGKEEKKVGLKGLMGCTSMFLVSPTAVYASHWFEDANFRGEEGSKEGRKIAKSFQKNVLGAMQKGATDHKSLKTVKKHFKDAYGIMVTSYKHRKAGTADRYDINPLRDGKEIITYNMEVRYGKEIEAIKAKVQEILGNGVTWLGGNVKGEGSTFGGYIAPLEKKHLVEAEEKLVGTAMFEYTPGDKKGKEPSYTMQVGQHRMNLSWKK